MKISSFAAFPLGLALSLILSHPVAGNPDASPTQGVADATSIVEARSRARLLHEAVHGALQIMHRDFFDPDDRDRIPSASLEDMFEVMAETHRVEFHWLGVNAKTMDSEHEPRDSFEEEAVQALSRGASEYESVEAAQFRYAGAIPLHNACLKCHVPNRTNLEERTAALAIRMPLSLDVTATESR